MASEDDATKYDYLQLKAYSVSAESDDADTVVFTLDDQRHLRVKRRVLRIMEAFDGTRRLSDVKEVLAHGETPVVCDDDQLREFVEKVLVGRGLLVGTSGPKQASRSGGLWVRFPLVHTDTFASVFCLGRHLYKPGIVLVNLLACTFLIVASALSVYSAGTRLGALDSGWLVLISYLSLVIHECGHVSAVYCYGLAAGRGGIGVYMFIPVFFVDLSSAWRLSVRQRVVVDLGGMYFQILTTIPLSIMGIVFHDSRYCMMALSVACMTAINLLPFARLDGYWILSDSLGLDNLSTNTWQVIKAAVRGRRTGYGRNYEVAAVFFALSSAVMIVLGLSAAYSTVTQFSTIMRRLGDGLANVASGRFAEGITILDDVFVTCIPVIFLAFIMGKIVFGIGSRFIEGIRASKGQSPS